eukprot:gb/GEZN01006945.1/.p1 GENE.gb/GEZN01006945.1/~~gb/GEZN01006945.1/.p1  ORF type:complete len:398 (+),score=77.74 gb/GEZN01006945.1/:30-1223(+)
MATTIQLTWQGRSCNLPAEGTSLQQLQSLGTAMSEAKTVLLTYRNAVGETVVLQSESDLAKLKTQGPQTAILTVLALSSGAESAATTAQPNRASAQPRPSCFGVPSAHEPAQQSGSSDPTQTLAQLLGCLNLNNRNSMASGTTTQAGLGSLLGAFGPLIPMVPQLLQQVLSNPQLMQLGAPILGVLQAQQQPQQLQMQGQQQPQGSVQQQAAMNAILQVLTQLCTLGQQPPQPQQQQHPLVQAAAASNNFPATPLVQPLVFSNVATTSPLMPLVGQIAAQASTLAAAAAQQAAAAQHAAAMAQQPFLRSSSALSSSSTPHINIPDSQGQGNPWREENPWTDGAQQGQGSRSETEFDLHLRVLAREGFTDRELNLDLLRQYRGNLVQVMRILRAIFQD